MAKGKIGFMPCFSRYKYSHFPIEKVYEKASYINKVKNLLSCFVDLENPMFLRNNCGVGKEIQIIRPDDRESIRIISLFSIPYQIYRIDYGKTKFRILFAINSEKRLSYILGFDTDHSTYRK